MKSIEFLTLIAFAISMVSPAAAQTDFRTAVITLKDGSRLKGEVDYPYWDEGTDRVLFRESEGIGRRFVSTGDIKELVLPEDPKERFFGSARQRLNYGIAESDWPSSDTLSYVRDTMLLQAVILGRASLYYHETRDGTPHYFMEHNGRLEELVQHRFFLVGKDRSLRKRHDGYRAQLKAVMSDCQKVTKRLDDFVLDDDNLFRLFKQYNSCGDREEIQYALLPLRPSWSFGPLAGIGFTRVSEKNQQLNMLSTGAWLPRIGLGAILHLPQSNERSGFMLEALYAPFQTEDNIDNIMVEADYLQLNLGIRKSGNTPIFGSAFTGLTYAMEMGSPSISGLPENVFFANQIGAFGGFGVGGNRFELSVRYEINNLGLILGSAPGYFSNTLSILAHYRVF